MPPDEELSDGGHVSSAAYPCSFYCSEIGLEEPLRAFNIVALFKSPVEVAQFLQALQKAFPAKGSEEDKHGWVLLALPGSYLFANRHTSVSPYS